MRVTKIFFSLLLYLLIIVYSLELLATFTLKKKYDLAQHSLDEYREMAIKNLPAYDNRANYTAFYEEREKNNIFPSFRLTFSHLHQGDWKNEIRNFIKKKIDNNNKIPFRGPMNKKSLGSNEEGFREIILNDKYGFKNKNKIYKKKIDVFLIGDSFAEGLPFGNDYTIGDVILKSSNLNVANYGISGTGPLIALGVINEYGKEFKPHNVFYLFYEGNDLDDMMKEKHTFLKKYLNENFTQDLIFSHNEVKAFLEEYENIFNKILPIKIGQEKELKSKFKYKNLIVKEKIKNFFELNTLKELIFSSSVFYKSKSHVDFIFFEKIILKIKNNVKRWGGSFYFVYLPSWDRYNNEYSLANTSFKRKIKGIVEKNKIQFIDVDDLFEENKVNDTKIFNLDLHGHYTKKGYEIIAKKIISLLN